MKQQQARILIMAGGTGGHIFPALAVAQDLREKNIDVAWLGTKEGLEATIIPKHDIPLYFLNIKGLRGRDIVRKIIVLFKLAFAIIQAMKIMLKVKPNCVLGMGGYASAPGGIATFLLRKPLIIHEQNAVVGMTNRWLAKFARYRLEGFPDVFQDRKNTFYVGNPVRREIIHMLGPKLRYEQRKGRLHVLVMGGSQGATWINEAIPKIISKLSPKTWPDIWHQTGKKDMVQVEHDYQKLSIYTKVEPFIDDMAKAYAWADVVICRAGALTISELMAAGTAAILIPLPQAVDDHQTKNALFLQALNAGIVLQQSDAALYEVINLLSSENIREKFLDMAEQSRQAAKIDATEQVVKYCLEFCHG